MDFLAQVLAPDSAGQPQFAGSGSLIGCGMAVRKAACMQLLRELVSISKFAAAVPDIEQAPAFRGLDA